MKKILLASALALASSRLFAADVGVSISVGEPGFYGRIDIGDFPGPEVIYAQPILVERSGMHGRPVYLRVPPGYERHWSRHCHEYRACGEPVYFVRDKWYREVYSPRYRECHSMERRGERGYERHEDRREEGGDHRGEEHDRH